MIEHPPIDWRPAPRYAPARQPICCDCHRVFRCDPHIRRWFQDRGLTPPRRCARCRAVRREARFRALELLEQLRREGFTLRRYDSGALNLPPELRQDPVLLRAITRLARHGEWPVEEGDPYA